MFETSSYALGLLLAALINPHPNICLISNTLPANFSSYNPKLISKDVLQKFYAESLNLRLRLLLRKEAKNLNLKVIDKVVTALSCAQQYKVKYLPILTVIDYSLPSNQKRMWIIDLNDEKLLYNTYVGHGINSGDLITNHFSNRNNSKASSLGVYLTEKAYIGREGMSMRLTGIDSKFNNNAANRYIVMHGGWYMNENFIQKYGRSGRSWGCPALPANLTSEIINTIKDGTFLVMYYPSEEWFQSSRFLNCQTQKLNIAKQCTASLEPLPVEKKSRETVFFASFDKEKAILVISAKNYKDYFNKTPPLERMLRRQINHEEYIALSATELDGLLNSSKKTELINNLQFVNPVIHNRRGYYITEMVFASKEKVVNIKLEMQKHHKPEFTLELASGKNIQLNPSANFIRWLGL